MRIAFLCKRQYMSKDVIVDRYARLYEIPFQLARRGHAVRAWCLSYQRHADGQWQHEAAPGSLQWESRGTGRLKLPALATYPSRLLRSLRAFEPDVVIGASDIPHVALAAWLAGRLRTPYAVDLYDNFEGFGQARIPGMVALLRNAARGAALVTTTSEPLRELVRDAYGAHGDVVAMPSTIDKAVFRQMDRMQCRRALGLPEGARLVGTAGGLLRDKGIGTLYAAWRHLSEADANLHLVLAGPIDPRLPPPAGARVHHLGNLPHSKTAELFNALDVGVIYLRDTPFGRYCFPQKAYEMLACGLPVVAAAIGVMPYLLAGQPDSLYPAEDERALAQAVLLRLSQPVRAAVRIEDWTQVIGVMDRHLVAAVERARASTPDRR
jgi:glycosyltransferase involved in cell wall biosynthesis